MPAQLDDLVKQGWQIADPIRRIWAGERDAAALTAGLDAQDGAIIRAILAQLAGDTPPAAPASDSTKPEPAPAVEDDAEPESQGLTLDQLFGMVKLATRPDAPAGLNEALVVVIRQLSSDPNMPDALHALGRVLNAILSGERAPDLGGLPADLTEQVGQLLQSLT